MRLATDQFHKLCYQDGSEVIITNALFGEIDEGLGKSNNRLTLLLCLVLSTIKIFKTFEMFDIGLC